MYISVQNIHVYICIKYILPHRPYYFLFIHIQNQQVGPTVLPPQSRADTWRRPPPPSRVACTRPGFPFLSPRAVFPAASPAVSGHLRPSFFFLSFPLLILYSFTRSLSSHTLSLSLLLSLLLRDVSRRPTSPPASSGHLRSRFHLQTLSFPTLYLVIRR